MRAGSLRGFGILLPVLLLCSFQASADDLSYVDNAELLEEKAAREGDIERTRQRIATLEARKAALMEEQKRVSAELKEIDEALVQRTMLMYRLSRNGKALRYLSSAESGIAFLKRIEMLKKLISSQMETRRAKGLVASELESSIGDTGIQLDGARQLEQELVRALAELNAEIERRSIRSYPWRQ